MRNSLLRIFNGNSWMIVVSLENDWRLPLPDVCAKSSQIVRCCVVDFIEVYAILFHNDWVSIISVLILIVASSFLSSPSASSFCSQGPGGHELGPISPGVYLFDVFTLHSPASNL